MLLYNHGRGKEPHRKRKSNENLNVMKKEKIIMRKHISIIATAIITGSIAMAGAMSSFATEDITSEMPVTTNHCTEMEQLQTETVSIDAVQFKADEVQAPTEAPTEAPIEAPTEAPTQAPTEAPTQAPTEAAKPEPLAIKDFAGKWTYQLINDIGSNIQDSKNGTIEIKEDGTFVYTDSNGKSITGIAKSVNEIVAGDNYKTITLTADGFSFTGSILYNGEVSIGAGASAKLVRSATATATTTAAATKKAATTTAAAKTTAKKDSSPKTGVAIPAIPVAGLAIAAVAVAFTLKKKSN